MATTWVLQKLQSRVVSSDHALFNFNGKSYLYVALGPRYSDNLAGIWKYDCAENIWQCVILYSNKDMQEHKPDPRAAFFDYKTKILYLYNLPSYPRVGTLLCVDILQKKIIRKVYLPKKLCDENNKQFTMKYTKFIYPEILIENNRLHAVYSNSTHGPLHMIWHNIFNGNNHITGANRVKLEVIELAHRLGPINLGHCLFYNTQKKAPIMFTNHAIYTFRKNTDGINEAVAAIINSNGKIISLLNDNTTNKKDLFECINDLNEGFNWYKVQSIYGNKVQSTSVICTDCSRYIITFGAVLTTFKRLIFVYDTEKHISLPGSLLCPKHPIFSVKNQPDNICAQFSAVYLHDFNQDARIVSIFTADVCSKYSLQYIPKALTALICKFYMLEYVHLICRTENAPNCEIHYKINLDAVFDNLYNYYVK